MSKLARLLSVLVPAALGLGVAVAVGAGDDGVRACANKADGAIHATRNGKCGRAQVAITISGSAFRSSARGKTLTINGVAFTKGRRGGTLTINGVSFQRGTGNTLTINGTALRDGATGPTGPQGRIGPTGPPGIPYGPPPVEAAGAVSAAAGGSAQVGSFTFTNSDGKAHRLLVTGGFDAGCNPCAAETLPGWSLERDATQLVTRRISAIDKSDVAGATVSEIVVTPDVCNPCTIALKLFVPVDASGGATTVDATHRRLGYVDLGPVAP